MTVLRVSQRCADGFLDPGHIQQALSQHRIGHLLVIDVGFLIPFLTLYIWQNHSEQLLVYGVFHVQQCGSDSLQHLVIVFMFAGNDGAKIIYLCLDIASQATQTQYTQGIADFLQHTHLGKQILYLAPAGTHINIQDILYLGQVFLDSCRHGLHQLYAGTGKTVPGLIHCRIGGKQVIQAVATPNCANTGTVAGGPGHVIQQVVDQLINVLGIQPFLTLVHDYFHGAVSLAKQAFQ